MIESPGTTAQILEQYSFEMKQELSDILQYWSDFTIDELHGGFIGKIDESGKRYPEAPKGSVLNSRILWTFAAACNLEENPAYLSIATRAFRYLADHFYDKDFGGVYWSVNYKGDPLDTKKQVYALAFAVYGLSEYYLLTKEEEARTLAVKIYEDIVKYSFDSTYGGYIEALHRDWKPMQDLRLSDKDANERKSMNTHLHILEGFANLYRIYPDKILKQRIIDLIHYFLDHIIDPGSHHLILFLDDEWHPKSGAVSYGHDIEAAWLIQEAAEIISVQDENNHSENRAENELINKVKKVSVLMADAAARGLDEDGGLWYEKEHNHVIKEKHWWPQAEAMVGFFNAFRLTGEQKYLDHSLAAWNFIKLHLKAPNGEWYWGIKEDYSTMSAEDKVGMWKCPYHNGRACIELIKRLGHSNSDRTSIIVNSNS